MSDRRVFLEFDPGIPPLRWGPRVEDQGRVSDAELLGAIADGHADSWGDETPLYSDDDLKYWLMNHDQRPEWWEQAGPQLPLCTDQECDHHGTAIMVEYKGYNRWRCEGSMTWIDG